MRIAFLLAPAQRYFSLSFHPRSPFSSVVVTLPLLSLCPSILFLASLSVDSSWGWWRRGDALPDHPLTTSPVILNLDQIDVLSDRRLHGDTNNSKYRVRFIWMKYSISFVSTALRRWFFSFREWTCFLPFLCLLDCPHAQNYYDQRLSYN